MAEQDKRTQALATTERRQDRDCDVNLRGARRLSDGKIVIMM